MSADKELTKRAMTLTEADLEALSALMHCSRSCSFSNEEVQFVRDWLDTAKTAKSEVIKWLVKIVIVSIGIISGIQVASRMGWFKVVGK